MIHRKVTLMHAVALLLLWPLSACVISGGPVNGTVLDEQTGDPVENAIVVARWEYEVKEDWQKRIKPEEVYIHVYKRGFVWSKNSGGGVQYLQPFTGDREERLTYLKRIEEATRCNAESEHLGVRSTLIKPLYKEARKSAATKRDFRIVDSLLYVLESMVIGDKQALKNLSERRRNRGE